MLRREMAYPLEKLPEDMQARIAEEVAQPKPPKRWLRSELAEMESRAWWEWHWQRGIDPDRRRRPLAPDLRQAIIKRDGLVCGICGNEVPADDVHIDHIQPVSRGGTDHPDNLQVAHSRCNIAKGARV